MSRCVLACEDGAVRRQFCLVFGEGHLEEAWALHDTSGGG